MNAALIYRARNRWLIWVAFGCAVMIHITAIVLAENGSRVASLGSMPSDEVIGIDNDQPLPAQQPDELLMSDQVPPVADEDAFPQENATPPPVPPRKRMPITPVVRSIGAGTGRVMHAGSVKALTMYAPRPNYPYEARRGGITGSGIAQLTVNPEFGDVIDARMAQTTGSTILDNATVETLRRWRFKPGVASNINVPITYTLTGVSY